MSGERQAARNEEDGCTNQKKAEFRDSVTESYTHEFGVRLCRIWLVRLVVFAPRLRVRGEARTWLERLLE